MIINNKKEIIEQLAEMLKKFDIDQNRYQTDVYLYMDENGNGSLDTFVNVGGRSWIEDNHYTIYSDKEHIENAIDEYMSELGEQVCETIGVCMEEIKAAIAEENEWNIEDVEDCEVKEYIKRDENYMKSITEEYIDSLNDIDYYSIAEEIMDRFVEEEEFKENNI